jgi:hypothetical protein
MLSSMYTQLPLIYTHIYPYSHPSSNPQIHCSHPYIQYTQLSSVFTACPQETPPVSTSRSVLLPHALLKAEFGKKWINGLVNCSVNALVGEFLHFTTGIFGWQGRPGPLTKEVPLHLRVHAALRRHHPLLLRHLLQGQAEQASNLPFRLN